MTRILAGVLMLLAAAVVHAGDAQDKAVKAVERLGGMVTRDETQPGKPIVGVDLSFKQVTDADLKELAPLKNLKNLNLAYPRHRDDDFTQPRLVTDDGLKHLAQLNNLTAIDLTGTKVTDAGLKHLAPLTKLTALDLSRTEVTDDGLKHLAPLKKLNHLTLASVSNQTLTELGKINLLHALSRAWAEGDRPAKPEDVTVLDLRGTDVTGAGLKELAPFKNLSKLRLPYRVTDAGLKELAPFTNLTTLNLSDTNVTDAGLKELAPLKNLADLNLSATQVKGTDLGVLAPLKNLITLDLNDTKITDEGLKTIAPLTSLTTLYLLDTGVTDAGVKNLAPLKNLSRLYLGGTKVTGEGLKELAPLKKLTFLDLSRIDDRTLAELGKIQLLHALHEAKGEFGRPTRPEDVLQFDLSDTKVTAEGLKSLAPLKNLVDLKLPQIDDKTLLELSKINLLHALLHGETAEGRPSSNPEDVIWLDLSRTKVTGEGIKALKPFTRLRFLDLPQVDDRTLVELGKVRLLHALPHARAAGGDRPTTPEEVLTLDLSETKVTADGLKALALLKNLAAIRLPEIDDKTLAELGKIHLLQTLPGVQTVDGELPTRPGDVIGINLEETKVTAAGLKELKPLKNLTTLGLPEVDDRTLEELVKIGLLHALPHATTANGDRPTKATDVAELHLVGTQVTDNGLKHLAPFKNLTTLVLGGEKVTDEGLKDLASFKSLTGLQFVSTGVTELGVQKLQKALPRCEISR